MGGEARRSSGLGKPAERGPWARTHTHTGSAPRPARRRAAACVWPVCSRRAASQARGRLGSAREHRAPLSGKMTRVASMARHVARGGFAGRHTWHAARRARAKLFCSLAESISLGPSELVGRQDNHLAPRRAGCARARERPRVLPTRQPACRPTSPRAVTSSALRRSRPAPPARPHRPARTPRRAAPSWCITKRRPLLSTPSRVDVLRGRASASTGRSAELEEGGDRQRLVVHASQGPVRGAVAHGREQRQVVDNLGGVERLRARGQRVVRARTHKGERRALSAGWPWVPAVVRSEW